LTILCKSCSRRIELVGLVLLGLAAAVSLFAFAASAQQTLEERYQKAIQSFNEAKMEDACDALKQIEKENAGYKDVRTYLNPACDSARRTYEQEERLYKQGLELFKQGQFDQAKPKFTQGRSLALNHPKYRAEMDDYLKKIEARVREENLFNKPFNSLTKGGIPKLQLNSGKSNRQRAREPTMPARTYSASKTAEKLRSGKRRTRAISRRSMRPSGPLMTNAIQMRRRASRH